MKFRFEPTGLLDINKHAYSGSNWEENWMVYGLTHGNSANHQNENHAPSYDLFSVKMPLIFYLFPTTV